MKKNNGILNFFPNFIKGAVIGIGGVLPGISGGVLCTVFGVYEPLMETVAHPKKNFKKNAAVLVPTVIGIFAGFLGLAKLIQMLFRSNEELAVCVFIGLIAGMLPSLRKKAYESGRTKSSHTAMTVAFVLMLALLLFIKLSAGITMVPNGAGFTVCGLLFGLGIVVPGLCGPSFMLFLGLYGPLMDLITGAVEHAVGFVSGKESFSAALGGMNIPYCLLFGGFALATILLLAKPVNYLIEKCPAEFRYAIFGIVAATLPPLIPSFEGGTDTLWKLLCIAAGFAATFITDKLTSKKISEAENEENTVA